MRTKRISHSVAIAVPMFLLLPRASLAQNGRKTDVIGKIDSVKVSSPFSIDVVATSPACGSDNGTIAIKPASGTPPYQYALNGGTPKSDGIFYLLSPGNYTVSVTDAGGRVATESVTLVNLYPQPTGSVLSYTEPSGCNTADGTFQLTATGGTPPYRYTLDHVNFQSGNTFTNMPPGWYNFFVYDAHGCWSNIPALPTGSACGAATPGVGLGYSGGACGNNGFVSFQQTSAGPPPDYTYSLDGVNYQSNGYFGNVGPGLVKTYIKDAQGNVYMQGIEIVPDCLAVIPTVQAPVCGGTAGTIICEGQNGSLPYQYSLDGVNYQYSDVFGGMAPGNYTLYVKDYYGTASTPVTVGTGCLAPSVVPQASTCGNANGSLSASAAGGTMPYTYSLNGAAFMSNGFFSGLTAGTYTITVKDAGGAQAATQATVSDIAGPTVSGQPTAAGCEDNDGSIVAAVQNGTGPFEYALNNVQYTAGNTFASLDTGTYTLRVKDANGCTASAVVRVTLNNNLQVDAGSNVTLCEGQGTPLSGTSNANTVTWSPAAGLSQANSLSTVATPSGTTQYYLTGVTGVCTAVDSLMITVNPAPIANAGTTVTICPGGQGQLSGSGGVSYTWSPAIGLSDTQVADPVASPSTTTTYSLTVLDQNGCGSLQPSTVQVAVTPPPVVFAGTDTSVAIGEPIQLTAVDVNNSGFIQYVWTPATGLSNPDIENPLATLDATETFTVAATTAAGCEGTASVTIKAYKGPDIYVPTGFSPNGDGYNDILKVVPIGIRDFKRFSIYNRWGVLMFSTSDPGLGWDGRFQGTDQPVGVYVWMVSGVDYNGRSVKKQGTVTLMK